jgi:hypothetical protein
LTSQVYKIQFVILKDIIAPVASLIDVLQAFEGSKSSDEYSDDWGELDSWNDFYYNLGKVTADNDGDNSTPWISDTQMMLIARKEETQNYQAILIQPCSNSNYFKRVGHFIHKPTRRYEPDDPEDFHIVDSEYGDYKHFEPIRAVFDCTRRILL